MIAKDLLLKRIEKEEAYLEEQTPGSDEYKHSQDRLNKMLEMLGTLEQSEQDTVRKDEQMKCEKKTKRNELIMDCVKVGLCGVVVPVAMTLLTFKFEESNSLSTALRGWVTNNVPKKYM